MHCRNSAFKVRRILPNMDTVLGGSSLLLADLERTNFTVAPSIICGTTSSMQMTGSTITYGVQNPPCVKMTLVGQLGGPLCSRSSITARGKLFSFSLMKGCA